MRFRKQDGGGDLFAALAHQQSATQHIVGILKLRDLIDWEDFRPVLNEVTGYTVRDLAREFLTKSENGFPSAPKHELSNRGSRKPHPATSRKEARRNRH